MGEVLSISALDPAAQETVHSSVGSTRYQWKNFRYIAINHPSSRNFSLLDVCQSGGFWGCHGAMKWTCRCCGEIGCNTQNYEKFCPMTVYSTCTMRVFLSQYYVCYLIIHYISTEYIYYIIYIIEAFGQVTKPAKHHRHQKVLIPVLSHCDNTSTYLVFAVISNYVIHNPPCSALISSCTSPSVKLIDIYASHK